MRRPSPARRAMHPGRVAVIALVAVLSVLGGLSPSGVGPANASAGVDDFPAAYPAGTIDPWRFYARTCTSFVAWRLNNDNHLAFTNGMGGGWFGNATTWADNARSLGYQVDATPAVGSVAHWYGSEMPGSGGLGHVAWVAAVNRDGSVLVDEYNYSRPLNYDQRVARAPRYIHLKDLGGSPPPPPPSSGPTPFSTMGAFVQQQFVDLLGRNATSSDVAYFTTAINTGRTTPDHTISTLARQGALAAYMAPAVRLYRAYFLRSPDHPGLRYWYDRLRTGVPLTDVSNSFASAPEFTWRYGNLNNADFVTLLYRNTLGRAPDPDGMQYWVGTLADGASRGDVMLWFSESAEFNQRLTTSTDITVLYEGMVQRIPDDPGLLYWINQTTTTSTGRDTMAGSLRISDEYAARVG